MKLVDVECYMCIHCFLCMFPHSDDTLLLAHAYDLHALLNVCGNYPSEIGTSVEAISEFSVAAEV